MSPKEAPRMGLLKALVVMGVTGREVATKTITRICKDLGLPPLQRVKRRRAPVIPSRSTSRS